MSPVLFLDLALRPAFRLLPVPMQSISARAMVLAICLQESELRARMQKSGGPARGYAQFERAGVQALLTHTASSVLITTFCEALDVKPTVYSLHGALQYHDVLTVLCTRLLLWTLPAPLPLRHETELAFGQYLAAWRPGKPRPETWATNYTMAWNLIEPLVIPGDLS